MMDSAQGYAIPRTRQLDNNNCYFFLSNNISSDSIHFWNDRLLAKTVDLKYGEVTRELVSNRSVL